MVHAEAPARATKHALLDYVMGTVGLALLRSWWINGDVVDPIRDELGILLKNGDESLGGGSVELENVGSVYAAWARCYDVENVDNPLFKVETTIFDTLFDFPHSGKALDAACGTGRNMSRLSNLGYDVSGVDLSREMLREAFSKYPQFDYTCADIRSLPMPDESFDLVFCALALTHMPELDDAISEFSRVLRPGGRIILIDVHPTQVMFGSHVSVIGREGNPIVARNFVHNSSSYFDAFISHCMQVEALVEPEYDEETVDTFTAAQWVPISNRVAYVGTSALIGWRAVKMQEIER